MITWGSLRCQCDVINVTNFHEILRYLFEILAMPLDVERDLIISVSRKIRAIFINSTPYFQKNVADNFKWFLLRHRRQRFVYFRFNKICSLMIIYKNLEIRETST